MVYAKGNIMYICIKHGWKEGTKITFPKDREAMPDDIPANTVLLLKQQPCAFWSKAPARSLVL